MARIQGVDLPRDKRVEIALTYIYGIGRTRAKEILGKAGVEEGIKVKDLSEDEVADMLRDKIARGLACVELCPHCGKPLAVGTSRAAKDM